METKHLLRDFTKSDSVHYKAPIDKGQVTELQPDLPEVKSVTDNAPNPLIDQSYFDLIYKSGSENTLNKLQTFMITYMNKTENLNVTALDVYKAINVWVNNERNILTL